MNLPHSDGPKTSRGKIVVVGVGRVGATFAYTCVLRGLGTELVLVDLDRQRAEGEAMDIAHAVPFAHSMVVRPGELADCVDAEVVVISAGASQRTGETRLQLARRNVGVLEGILAAWEAHPPNGVVIIATNPVDVLTHVAANRLDLPWGRVIGSGTTLDTARLQVLLGEHYEVDPRSVHGFILGEHGDTEVAAWSLMRIAGMGVADFCRARGMGDSAAAMERVFANTRDAAYAIIERKGATHFAIGAALVRIVRAILRDERSVLTLSVPTRGILGLPDVSLSLPCVVGADGVRSCLEIPLARDERAALELSAEALADAIAQVS